MRARSPLSPKTPPWKAQVRLCKRSRPLSARGKTANPVVVVIAHTLRAVLWAIAQEVRLPAELGQRARSPMDRATRFRTEIGRGAAPWWGHHRRREAAARNPRASREAGTRRRPVRCSPTPGDPQAQPSSVTGSGSADDQRSSEKDDAVKTFRCGLDIGSQINDQSSAARRLCAASAAAGVRRDSYWEAALFRPQIRRPPNSPRKIPPAHHGTRRT
jgi:hypothetical protein